MTVSAPAADRHARAARGAAAARWPAVAVLTALLPGAVAGWRRRASPFGTRAAGCLPGIIVAPDAAALLHRAPATGRGTAWPGVPLR